LAEKKGYLNLIKVEVKCPQFEVLKKKSEVKYDVKVQESKCLIHP
jgi:hypothetical protein